MKKLGPANLAAFVCPHVFKDERPILYVCRADGDWQFLCGEEDHSDADGHVVGVGHLTDRDPTLHELADLPSDYEAQRKQTGQAWVIAKCR